MSNFNSNQLKSSFSSGQIVALDNSYGTLYAETIETIVQRQMCWVRGIAITLSKDVVDTMTQSNQYIPYQDSESDKEAVPLGNKTDLYSQSPFSSWGKGEISFDNSPIFPDGINSDTVLIDLYRNVDLLFPLDLFRVAFDTEIIPILRIIEPYPNRSDYDTKSSRQWLNWFLNEIWQTNQNKF